MEPNLDQFFTPKLKAKQYVSMVDAMFGIPSFDNVIEPSAGAGAFLDALPSRAIGIDLEPKDERVQKQDFFDFTFPHGNNLVIGNPPYGRRGSLALKFINRCADNARVIAFVLPRGFMRTAMQNSVDLRLHLRHSEMLDNFELPDGTEYKVKSVFQIWERTEEQREKIEEPKTHPDFELLHKHLSWITTEELDEIKAEYPYVIGQNKMRIQESKHVTKGSMWFIKPSVKDVEKVFAQATFESAYWTTGAPSLSKGDIINGYKIANTQSGRRESNTI